MEGDRESSRPGRTRPLRHPPAARAPCVLLSGDKSRPPHLQSRDLDHFCTEACEEPTRAHACDGKVQRALISWRTVASARAASGPRSAPPPHPLQKGCQTTFLKKKKKKICPFDGSPSPSPNSGCHLRRSVIRCQPPSQATSVSCCSFCCALCPS